MEIKKIAIIAGRGQLPILACQEARKNGVEEIFILAFHGQASEGLEKYADKLVWSSVGRFRKNLKILRENKVTDLILVGQIKPTSLFSGLKPDLKALKMLWRLKKKNAETIFSGIVAILEENGQNVLPSTIFLSQQLATKGIMGKKKPNRSSVDDCEYAIDLAKKISSLDIGQMIAIKKGVIIAIEDFEGTDKTIKRAGKIARGGITVAKVAKKDHDMRFDVPCIGERTIEFLIEAKAVTLVVEANKTILINKEEVIKMCNKAKIALLGV